MCEKNSSQPREHEEPFSDAENLVNILRILSMLEKALNRAVRRKYYCRRQYPEIYFQIENTQYRKIKHGSKYSFAYNRNTEKSSARS